ncbi:hypothetical protein CANARDRAFT_25772 [[Candida] arabinofermentans NRRL YB-2248]|uniref:Secreted protein CSS2 C-terminal domain-containing protein n=1 Tax=[Candida] arabinofermentans NRRL YB-2248 TaxID=983967 RepID=A0A1E4SSV0_9ASCO|nr:hypothetical protein CANARDRAFT_25772 [[Candida] arabinofermentans NRRL YB-2248]
MYPTSIISVYLSLLTLMATHDQYKDKIQIVNNVLGNLADFVDLNEIYETLNLSSEEGDNVVSLDRRQNSCNGNSWVKKVGNIAKTSIKSLKAMWSEYGWSGAAKVLEDLTSLAANALTVADYVADHLGQKKSTFESLSVLADGYVITINNYTTGSNCDTQAALDSLSQVIERSILDAKNRKLIAWCITVENGGTWTAKVKFLNELYISCLSVGNIDCPSKAEVIKDEF